MMELANAKEAALQNLGKTASFGRPATNGLTSRASAPTAGGALREPDPVDMHLVSEMEALQLFEQCVSFLMPSATSMLTVLILCDSRP